MEIAKVKIPFFLLKREIKNGYASLQRREEIKDKEVILIYDKNKLYIPKLKKVYSYTTEKHEIPLSAIVERF